MPPVRAKHLFMLALVGTLLPASFTAASTLITRISFTAVNGGPVNPVVGLFEFQVKLPPSIDLPAGFNDVEILRQLPVGPPALTAVGVNYGSFNTENVAAFFEDGAVIPLVVGGTAGGGIGDPVLGDDELVEGVDDFTLGFISFFETPRPSFVYTVSGHHGSWGASQFADPTPSDRLMIRVEAVVSNS